MNTKSIKTKVPLTKAEKRRVSRIAYDLWDNEADRRDGRWTVESVLRRAGVIGKKEKKTSSTSLPASNDSFYTWRHKKLCDRDVFVFEDTEKSPDFILCREYNFDGFMKHKLDVEHWIYMHHKSGRTMRWKEVNDENISFRKLRFFLPYNLPK